MQSIVESFQASRYHDVITYFKSSDLRPQSDPYACKFVAASYFKLGNFSEALELQEEIFPSFDGDPLFLSMYGATLRHLGRLNDAFSIFSQALDIEPDSAALKNNFANLLIDQKRYQEAHKILSELIESDPQYSDARQNLLRVQQLLSTESTSSTSLNAEDKSVEKSISNDDFYDPLFLAFSEEEVKRTAPFRPSGFNNSQSQSLSNFENTLTPPDTNLVALDQLKLAQSAVTEKNPQYALELCSKVHHHLSHHADLYSCVGDAYISLKRFNDAESAFLHALIIGGDSFKIYFNLATISLMRKNCGLANYYLSKASTIDSSHPQLATIQKSISQLASDLTARESFSFLDKNPFPVV